MTSHRWTTVARVAVLLIAVGVGIDVMGWKPGAYVAGAGCLVLLMTLNAP